jgi:glycosyltransferase involved in cell wall biosynthesis
VSNISCIEYDAAFFDGYRCQPMVNYGGSEEAQSGMAMFFVVPGKELPGMRPGIFQASEAFRKVGPVFQRSEVTFRIGVVVRHVRAALYLRLRSRKSSAYRRPTSIKTPSACSFPSSLDNTCLSVPVSLKPDVKTVIGSRLKQAGMFWSVRGANAIIALRCGHVNNRLATSMSHTPRRAPLLSLVLNMSPPAMKPLRLLAIIEAYSITGPAKNLLSFVGQAQREQLSTTIVTFTRGEPDNLFVSTARGQGIVVETIPERGPFDPRVVRSLHDIVDRFSPDIIQTHAVKSHFLARLAGLPRRAPWVAFHHGYTWPTRKTRLYNQLDRWSLAGAAQVLTVSEPFRDELAAFGVARNRIQIVHNAIPAEWGTLASEPNEADALRIQAGIPPGRQVILIVGRLSREKDHLTLLEAVYRLSRTSDVHLVIVGEGPERARIEQRTANLGLADRVTLTGQQPSARPWYGLADVAVLSSLSEGSPNALLEAMVMGVPAVATRVGGIPEIVADEESALLVEPGNVAQMETAIRRLLTDSKLVAALTKRSHELIAERHAPEARMQRLVSLYRGLLD